MRANAGEHEPKYRREQTTQTRTLDEGMGVYKVLARESDSGRDPNDRRALFPR